MGVEDSASQFTKIDAKKMIDSHLAHFSKQSVNSTSLPIKLPSVLNVKKVLVVAPHPDDEVFLGALALRLKLEIGAQIVVHPYSWGSKPERQAERQQELKASLEVLGFDLSTGVGSDGLQEVIQNLKPDLIISPHEFDAHPTHVQCYQAVHSAILKNGFNGVWVQQGYWSCPRKPNLIFEINREVATDLLFALLKHAGEIERNDYHLRLPAFWIDQVRLGSELVQGVGAQGLGWAFGQMAECVQVQNGKMQPIDTFVLAASG